MAKKKKLEHNYWPFLSIVAIVAVVAVVMMVTNTGTTTVSEEEKVITYLEGEKDLAGQATYDQDLYKQCRQDTDCWQTFYGDCYLPNCKAFTSWSEEWASCIDECLAEALGEEDNMIYLEGTSCIASDSAKECEGTKFLVFTGDDCEAHLIEITDIDVEITDINQVTNFVSFKDITSGTETNDYHFAIDIPFDPQLGGIDSTIVLSIIAVEDPYFENKPPGVNFINLGSCKPLVK